MTTRFPTRKLVRFESTGDVIIDAEFALRTVETEFPSTAFETPVTLVIDFGDSDITTQALREWIVPLGQRLRGGLHGNVASVVIATARKELSEIIGLLARAYDLPIFVSHSSTDVRSASPSGDVTASDLETLDQLRVLGGRATAAELAVSLAINPNAASNRLANLERKGYIFREHRGRREGDEYLDPRADLPSADVLRRAAPKPMRSALLSSGIESDPYDRSDIVLEGDAGERAAEILRRRKKAR